jgi:hypothetical protein
VAGAFSLLVLAPLAPVGCGGPVFSAAPADAATSLDAPPGPDSGGGPDSAPETSIADSPGPADVVRLDAPTGTYCSTQTNRLFCDDFDTLPLPSNFTDQTLGGGGVLSYDSVIYHSAPNALLSTTPAASSASTGAKALLSKVFIKDGSHIFVQADLRIRAECVLGSDTVTPIGLVFSDYALLVVATSTSSSLIEAQLGPDGGATSLYAHPLAMPFPVDVWFTFTLDAQLGAAHAIGINVNGVPMLSGANARTTIEPAIAPQHPALAVGSVVMTLPSASTIGCAVHVDNVLLDIHLL